MPKRTDKWSPSNIDWTRLSLVMIVEHETDYDWETSKEYSYPFDYLLAANLPATFPVVEHGLEREAINAAFKILTLDNDQRAYSRCGVCGHAVKYGGILVDLELGEGVMVGNDCLATYDQVSGGFEQAQYEARRLAKIARGYARFNAFVADKPELAHSFIIGEGHHIVNDIAAKLREYGSISQRQIDLVNKVALEYFTAQTTVVAPRPEPLDAPEGKVTVVGEIVAIKSVDGYAYGQRTTKMLVEHTDGWKVWVTMPLQLNAERGDTVQFDAVLTRSPGDTKFAFGKRPTKAIVLAELEPV